MERRRSLPSQVILGIALGAICLTAGLVPIEANSQIPDDFTNLQVLPPDISSDALIEVMRDFSFALNVRCQYCHVGGDGISFEGVEFASDDDADKRKARLMLEMVAQLNDDFLATLPDRDEPEVSVSCKTCHRGRPRPIMLAQELRIALDEFGPDSAVVRYERYREETALTGMFNFGEWEVNVLGEQLQREERLEDAIAIYELNGRHYPNSVPIHLSLGTLHESNSDVESAIERYRRVLGLDPDNRAALERLEAIGG